jgi:hypothetical protein
MSHLRILAAAAAFLACLASARAQQITPTLGVYIDAEGVLRTTGKPDERLDGLRAKAAKLPKDNKLVYVSLPRVFAEARKFREKGEPLPPEVRFLGGMTRLRYIFVYPDEKDLVIAGPAEPFDVDVAYRPLGRITGRPVLQLDDLVTALRHVGPGGKARALGCTLEVTQEIFDRIQKRTKEVGPKAPSIGNRRASDLISEAAGPQPVKYIGLAPDNRYAAVCIEADYLLKMFSLGLIESPTPKVKSYLAHSTGAGKPHRFAFECAYDPMGVSTDGLAFELRGTSLKVDTSLYSVEKQDIKEGEISPAARYFTRDLSRHFDEVSRHIPAFADLANLSDLAVLSALIARDELHAKVGWDLAWILDPAACKVEHVKAPTSAQTLCSYRLYGNTTVFSAGGVLLAADSWIKDRATDEKGELQGYSQRPGAEKWALTRKMP